MNMHQPTPSGDDLPDEASGGVAVFAPSATKALSDKANRQQQGVEIFEVRDEERAYAFLPEPENKETNRYGDSLDLIARSGGELPVGNELFINDQPGVGCNPNRNLQHGFYFNADNCIGCHACEAACSEKNDNPAHIAFRSVGYVEGGSYPAVKRLNISMACNHCDDPVCLKGCPTRAYTKHTEYGAVLQDPETCFGCGYCTWVCPYNAPQLDPVQGQVSKCNMCVDRLEVGLKPACVSACLGNALDFGVVDNTPENREQLETSIPGFPDPEITHPNIRFQQQAVLPEQMGRTDTAPVQYQRDEAGSYTPVVDEKNGRKKSWNIARLSSRENPLVLFTLASQAAIGSFLLVFLGGEFNVAGLGAFKSTAMYVPQMILSFLLVAGGLFMSTLHLGKPIRFYRGFNNCRYSPVAREGLGIAAFMAGLAVHILCLLPTNSVFSSLCASWLGIEFDAALTGTGIQSVATIAGYIAMLSGFVGLYYMNRCYRIPARPFWNHWQVASSFAGSMLALGAVVGGTVAGVALLIGGGSVNSVLEFSAAVVLSGVAIELLGLRYHARDMKQASHEGAASHYVQCTTFGKTYVLRNVMLCAALLIAVVIISGLATSGVNLLLWAVLCTVTLMAAVAGRCLFYVLVIPTTMPGAFFWKNKGFEEHARDIGLADMPQVGVIPDAH